MNKEIKQDILERISSRKFQAFVVGFISATTLLYAGFLTGALWVEFIKWVFGLYVAGNGLEKIANSMKKNA